jgi:hypothetical protein
MIRDEIRLLERANGHDPRSKFLKWWKESWIARWMMR